jgi:putative transposase
MANDLRGYHAIRARRRQRPVLDSWALSQLRRLVAYKAALAGVPLLLVDPRNSSRECSCGHAAPKNRPHQSTFRSLVDIERTRMSTLLSSFGAGRL